MRVNETVLSYNLLGNCESISDNKIDMDINMSNIRDNNINFLVTTITNIFANNLLISRFDLLSYIKKLYLKNITLNDVDNAINEVINKPLIDKYGDTGKIQFINNYYIYEPPQKQTKYTTPIPNTVYEDESDIF